jgi:transcription elongation factor GreA
MQIPKRKSENRRLVPVDTLITKEKYQELAQKLQRMKEINHPRLSAEVKRLAQFGDFSENAEYQIAKGKLRSLNQRILETEYQINHAQVIEANKNTDRVCVGHTVTVLVKGKEKTYKILGSTETAPSAGVISRHSPLGQSLLGARIGESVEVALVGKLVVYKIVNIE